MSASPSYGERPSMQGGFRRSFTLPARQLSVHEKAGLDKGDANADILYSHPSARIISFSPPASSVKSTSKAEIPADTDYPIDTVETLPWRSRSETLIATGVLIIEKVRGSTNFLKCQAIMHAILRNSQCWCVDGESKFVLRVRKFQYYRIELPSTSEEDKAKVEELKRVFPTILRFERTPCPFIRAFTVDLPDDAITPRRKGQWKRRDSSQNNASDTETPPLVRKNLERSWSMKTPPTSYPRNGPSTNIETERGRSGNPAILYRRGSLMENHRNSSPASFDLSGDGTDSERHDSEHESEVEGLINRSGASSPQKHLEKPQKKERVMVDLAADKIEEHATSVQTLAPEVDSGFVESSIDDGSRVIPAASSVESRSGNVADSEPLGDHSDTHMPFLQDKIRVGAEPSEEVAYDTKHTLDTGAKPQLIETEDLIRSAPEEHVTDRGKCAVLAIEVAQSRESPRNDYESMKNNPSLHQQIQELSEEVEDNTIRENAPDVTEHISQPNKDMLTIASNPISTESDNGLSESDASGLRMQKDISVDVTSNSPQELNFTAPNTQKLRRGQSPEHDSVAESLHGSSPEFTLLATHPPSQPDTIGPLETDLSPSPVSETEQSPLFESLLSSIRNAHQDLELTSITDSTPPLGNPPSHETNREIWPLDVKSHGMRNSQSLHEGVETSQDTGNMEDDAELSPVSSVDSFYTIASLTHGGSLSEQSDGEDTPTAERRLPFAKRFSRHKREISEITVTASSGSEPASPEQIRSLKHGNDQSETPSHLHSSWSDASWPEPATRLPEPQEQEEVLRQRFKTRQRSFSPLPPASTIFTGNRIRHDSGSGHMTKTILHKMVVKPIEVAIFVVHILARIAGGATVNDLLNGELFKSPEQQKKISGFADQQGDGRSSSDTEDDYGVPIRGRRRSSELRRAMVFDNEVADQFEDVD